MLLVSLLNRVVGNPGFSAGILEVTSSAPELAGMMDLEKRDAHGSQKPHRVLARSEQAVEVFQSQGAPAGRGGIKHLPDRLNPPCADRPRHVVADLGPLMFNSMPSRFSAAFSSSTTHRPRLIV